MECDDILLVRKFVCNEFEARRAFGALKANRKGVQMTGHKIHPLAREAKALLAKGTLPRRDFLRIATLVGVSTAAASLMAGSTLPVTAAEDNLPFPVGDPKAKAGGVLRVGMQVPSLKDPAVFDSAEMANLARHMVEHIAMIGPDNIARPMLAETWSASKDLKTWTIKFREGIVWHSGEELVAEHIAWNVSRWLDPKRTPGSPVPGLSTFAAMVSGQGATVKQIPGAVEIVDKYTLRLNLKRPVLSVMEDCAHLATGICHPSFREPLSNNLNGTGPFTISEYSEDDVCILSRVTETENGDPFVYWGGEVFLDEIHYYKSLDDDDLDAYGTGDVDFIHAIESDQIAAARELGADVHSGRTSRTLVCRMRVSQEPFADVRIREAVVRAIDNAALKALVAPVGGDVGENHHVAPSHPDYAKLAPLVRNVEKARTLLTEAERLDGLELTILVGDVETGWQKKLCDAMAKQLLEAGIKLNVNMVPPSEFAALSKNAGFAAVPWTHRPLGTMALSLAYRAGSAWNDSHFGDPDFESALDSAEATLDMAKRRARMQKVERILQDSFVMVQPVFIPVHAASSTKVQGFVAHPTQEHHFHKVWVA